MSESSQAGSLIDARGIPITAGDTVIYGFGVGRSVAMAEGVVLAEKEGYPMPSQTKTGRIRIRVIRRSYASGSKPVVDVAGDRLVVLKQNDYPGGLWPYLPPSLLPTQDEEERQRIENLLKIYTADLRATDVPARHYYEGWSLERFHAFAADRLKELREELRKHDERTA
jgi:hypothetical protein